MVVIVSLLGVAQPAYAAAGVSGSQTFDYTFMNGAAAVSCRFTFTMQNADYNSQANVGYIQFDISAQNGSNLADCTTAVPGTYLGVYWRTPDDGGGHGDGNLSANFGTALPTHYTRIVSPVGTNQPGFQMTLVGSFAHCTSGCDFAPLMEAPVAPK